MRIQGKALVMGDNVNTDELHPSQFYSLDDRRVRSGFLQAAAGYERIGSGDLAGRVIVAGDNFGCGSSRETGARAFLLAGVRAVVARSLARIFSRNVRNLGLAAVECPALPAIAPDVDVELDLERRRLQVPAAALDLPLTPLDPMWAAVLAAGGLLPFLGIGEPGGATRCGASLPVVQGTR
ncbi:MAG: 3-isopropylmalate dehydratase [Deltaproteobacteria bacterium]|nr:MAG: 3-isopropylmalate dehydratase [Deltaproteobacteria bacterium]TMQ14468.1 MAG: 3-isopropylmalate dehydratase [Deltaproteobacteria bacterium]